MASIIGDLIAGILELAFWAVLEILPVVCYFTALALVFLATFGRVAVEFPENLVKVGWQGNTGLRVRITSEQSSPLRSVS
jgi:hypothetical protein